MIRLDVAAAAAAAVCVSNREEIFFSPPSLYCALRNVFCCVWWWWCTHTHTHTTKRKREEAFLNAIEKETREGETRREKRSFERASVGSCIDTMRSMRFIRQRIDDDGRRVGDK